MCLKSTQLLKRRGAGCFPGANKAAGGFGQRRRRARQASGRFVPERIPLIAKARGSGTGAKVQTASPEALRRTQPGFDGGGGRLKLGPADRVLGGNR